jgi:hypothetical protein
LAVFGYLAFLMTVGSGVATLVSCIYQIPNNGFDFGRLYFFLGYPAAASG